MTVNKVEIIKAVEKPINLLVLIFIMIEASIVGMASMFEPQRDFLIYFLVTFFALYPLIIVLIGFIKPEFFQGTRKWEEIYADKLADDIYISLEGYLSNLNEGEDLEA